MEMATEEKLVSSAPANSLVYTPSDNNQLHLSSNGIAVPPDEQKSRWTVNRQLLTAKLHYFLFFGSVAGIIPFAIKYVTEAGASPSQVGVLYSFLPFITLLARPVAGAISDKFHQHRAVFLASIAITVSGFFTIYFIPLRQPWLAVNLTEAANPTVHCDTNGLFLTFPCSDPGGPDYLNPVRELACNLTCYPDNVTVTHREFIAAFILEENSTWCPRYRTVMLKTGGGPAPPPTCPLTNNLTCNTTCPLNNPHEEIQTNPEQSGVPSAVYWFGALMVFANVGMGIGTSMGDTIVLDILGDRGVLFGRQRLWGAVGWGVFSILSGLLIDLMSNRAGMMVFTPGFFVVLVLGVADLIVASRVPVSHAKKPPTHLGRDSVMLFADPGVLLFGLAVFMVGMFTGVLWIFLIMYLNGLGASQLLIGLSLGVQCFLGEMPFFFVANWFLEKIGHVHSMTLVLAVLAVRFFLYSMVLNPWLALPVDILHGITYGVFFTALATYPSMVAPNEMAATVQGIFQGLFEGCGVGVGNLVGGYLYEKYGGKTMFRTLSATAVITVAVYGGLQFLLKMCRRKASRKKRQGGAEVELNPIVRRKKTDKNLLDAKGVCEPMIKNEKLLGDKM